MRTPIALCMVLTMIAEVGAQKPAFEVGGWHTAKWGMTIAEVSAAIGKPVEPLGTPFEVIGHAVPKMTHGGGTHPIGGVEFQVHLAFVDGKLAAAHLQHLGKADKGMFERVQKALQGQGLPAQKAEKDVVGFVTTWNGDGGEVKLVLMAKMLEAVFKRTP